MRVFASALVVIAALALAGCDDECGALADKICQCEPTLAERESCRVELEAQQSNQALPPSDEQKAVCAAALETCTCDALDENRTDLCGFTREPGAGDEAGS
jgi:hypothetical protein